jgi:hypothetical protein
MQHWQSIVECHFATVQFLWLQYSPFKEISNKAYDHNNGSFLTSDELTDRFNNVMSENLKYIEENYMLQHKLGKVKSCPFT